MKRDALTPFPSAQVIPESEGTLHKEVTALAYLLFVARGRKPGRELDDWLEAERVVLQRRHQALQRTVRVNDRADLHVIGPYRPGSDGPTRTARGKVASPGNPKGTTTLADPGRRRSARRTPQRGPMFTSLSSQGDPFQRSAEKSLIRNDQESDIRRLRRKAQLPAPSTS